ncbi:MAG: RagB/SusD family nutrient uptake outer membrane protein [Prolixibacteraceae bacterium]|jgi:starch-binding outer membrane protein, SusD/RagB family|nr:RagB/SusD family nutrient uptake outer membrane protein [Prolixibacteraceae bacterium]MBT6005526.1 RagB/SusD family nutrient uptake outer membrane protein [Prolixibacteraceae bacterium]MBT6763643.1 RagB/SusD family nutrient uptake outer membrane protein [Prolixibacteraceae bacterium]MBT6997261.1 RagB/SusD family nutrient uptake outer membrane protein [Prolixibacteraceae bacterium]MBT7395049.1 RagB/SusD family nutrient uptake outer membrane protein [Prolixibacteraceae bacterium]
MRNINKYTITISAFLLSLILFSSCTEFLNPDQEINITEDKLFDDWYEYRSIEMGLYGLQAELVEQIVILGELRADLLQITETADADMVEIYNFNITSENKYASPTNFFKLISASNNFIKVLQNKHPEVLDPASPINNYDRLYGEALCMRAWAYFNAVRIYGKVPFIHESLTSIDEVNNYLNSPGTYIDSVNIVYGLNGYDNDTLYNSPISLEKQYFSQDLIIDYFTNELENKVKAVGVNHHIENNDETWEVTIWNTHAWHTLLGSMYLTDGDLAKAVYHFEKIVYLPSDNYRYQLDQSFSNWNWRNIFNNIDLKEHIFTLWFNKSNFQQNQLQTFFEPRPPHKYMLKPTRRAILNWETTWDNFTLQTNNSQPWLAKTVWKGMPGDFSRGYGVSYAYLQNGVPISESNVFASLWLKSEGDFRTADVLIQDVDTVVWKYSWNKNVFDQDANFIVYRAAGVHLWLAEAYVYWKFVRNNVPSNFTSNAVNIVNNGANYSADLSRPQLGVRGRVGFGGSNDGIRVGNINYLRDPFSNEITGYLDFTGDFLSLQLYLEELIMDERARELAFEGERFYDLMRVAKRRNDPSYLAEKVSEKFPSGRREEIYNLLLNENNWYINYFE